jgi:hypothetical protein
VDASAHVNGKYIGVMDKLPFKQVATLRFNHNNGEDIPRF